MGKFLLKEIPNKLKHLWWLVGLLTIFLGWYFTAKSTVLSAQSSAKSIIEIEKEIVEIKVFNGEQKVKNEYYDSAIIESREMFREIRDDVREIHRRM